MAVKTITIDMGAYEALARRKRAGESFSNVIKPSSARAASDATFWRLWGGASLSEPTLKRAEAAVAARRRHRARIPRL